MSRIERGQTREAAAAVPVVCRSAREGDKADGSRSDAAMSDVVNSERERGHGNVDVNDPLRSSSRKDTPPQLATTCRLALPRNRSANGAIGPTTTAAQNHRRDDRLRSAAIADARGIDPIETITKIQNDMVFLQREPEQ